MRNKIKLCALEEPVSSFSFKLPKGACFLKADMTFIRSNILDHRSSEMRFVPGLWFAVDEAEPQEERFFQLVGTNQEVPDLEKMVYLDTLQNTIPDPHGNIKHFVYHLFERKAEAP